MSGAAPATILTSAVGLGIYIPSLLIERQLRSRGLAAEVELIEALYTPGQLDAHLRHREAHHQSFALAQMANRMARDVQDSLDESRVAALLAAWAAQGRTRFIVWSGFWLPLLARYRAMVGQTLDVDHCRIDAVPSASFRIHPELDRHGREIWLWHAATQRVVHEIAVDPTPARPWARRERRLLVHGGGWGIGDYREHLAALSAAGWALDLVIHQRDEAVFYGPHDRCFLPEPGWQPWLRHEGRLDFPPMLEVGPEGGRGVRRNAQWHPMHAIVREAQAVVSKPGGCTLIDSLAAGTPLVLLQAYGQAEPFNAQVWQALGYGLTLAQWRDAGFSPSLLETAAARIQQRQHAPDYVAKWVTR